MKMKFALAMSLSVAAFTGSLFATSARADVYPDPQCFRACQQEYRLCMTYTPDKAVLCERRRRECLTDCGTYL
ncbi:hypothetical protein [Pseudomarimonas arenosa]|uniref:Uncharacterized protein n=1 Tax=Pseudomarimonas arenosa TaxID=2774145 RepID=A0AAW3ZJ06_9GAMM|nr:hypothetical protein [Pseudomarimonas arenosa]MBD8525961.1 hypothetical protein [Pseudomarimonas arenosa]